MRVIAQLQAKNRGRGSNTVLTLVLLNLLLSCRLLGKTTGQAVTYFPMKASSLPANLTEEAWLSPFIINIFENCLPRHIFNGLDSGQLLTEQRTEYSSYGGCKIGFQGVGLAFS